MSRDQKFENPHLSLHLNGLNIHPSGCVVRTFVCYASGMDPLHATIEQFAAEGFTHIECYCPPMPHREVDAYGSVGFRASRWDSPSHSFQRGCAVGSAAV